MDPRFAAFSATALSFLSAALGAAEAVTWALWGFAVCAVISVILTQRGQPFRQIFTLLYIPISWLIFFQLLSHSPKQCHFAIRPTAQNIGTVQTSSNDNHLLIKTTVEPKLTGTATGADVLVTLDGWLDPFLLATPYRYDILHKLVAALGEVGGWRSDFGWDLYLEHERRWSGFKEDHKSSALDFRMDFVALISSIKAGGFREDAAIPVCDMEGKVFPTNGAHRTAVALALHRKVRVKPYVGNPICPNNLHPTSLTFNDHPKGSNQVNTDYAMYRWLWHSKDKKRIRLLTLWPFALQQRRGNLTDPVGHFLPKHKFLSLWLQKTILLTPLGILNYVQHAYGSVYVHEKWLFVLGDIARNSTRRYPLTLYWLGEDPHSPIAEPTKHFREAIRDHYFPNMNGTRSNQLKSTIHATDGFGDTLLLSQLALFPHSINYLNVADNRSACMDRSERLGRALGRAEVVPGIRLDVMAEAPFLLDSGSVLDVFGLRPGSDLDLAYDSVRSPGIKRLIGQQKMIDDHGSDTKWYKFHNVKAVELLTNPKYYFYCYGVRYVSVPQLIEYKERRNEKPKDVIDVKLLKLLNISSNIS